MPTQRPAAAHRDGSFCVLAAAARASILESKEPLAHRVSASPCENALFDYRARSVSVCARSLSTRAREYTSGKNSSLAHNACRLLKNGLSG